MPSRTLRQVQENDLVHERAAGPCGMAAKSACQRCDRSFLLLPAAVTPVGLPPRACPLHVVVGKPIPVAKVAAPSTEDIDKVHTEYCSQLAMLYDNKYLV